MKKQIIVIHGGDTFGTYGEYIQFLKDWQIDFEDYRAVKSGWKSRLGSDLGDDFEVIQPNMPNKMNAKYFEWKIWFEKFIPYFESEVVLVGHSLGGIFLAKYLSENDFKKKIKAVFLVASPFNAEGADYSLSDFILPESLAKMEAQCDKIFLYHNKDDQVVPFSALGKYRGQFKNAEIKIFENRGHFNQEEFAELVEDIKGL